MLPAGWQATAAKVAMQGTVLAALGGVAHLVRVATTPALDPRVVAVHPALGGKHAALCATLTQLATLTDGAGLQPLLQNVRAILELEAGGGAGAQWQIARLSTRVCRDAETLCKQAMRHGSAADFMASVTASEEALPQLRTHLDNLLHNHLLDRALT